MITIGDNTFPMLLNKEPLGIINDEDTNIKFIGIDKYKNLKYNFQNNSDDKKQVFIYPIDASNNNKIATQELQNFLQSDIKKLINNISKTKLNDYSRNYFFTNENLELKKEDFLLN